jgi:hypothetical protein
MGVLTCNRGDCENIMCNSHSCEYGYLCCDCKDELKLKFQDVGTFMKSKKTKIDNIEIWEAYVDSIFSDN